MSAGHGPNLGHGYVKYIIIDGHGRELAPIIFPAQIARRGSARRRGARAHAGRRGGSGGPPILDG